MIPADQLDELFSSPWLTIELQEKGGHCAFIKNWRLESWASDRVSELVKQQQEAIE